MIVIPKKALVSLALIALSAAGAFLAFVPPGDQPTRDESGHVDASTSDVDLLIAEASSFTLGNGLQVVVIPDKSVERVAHTIWYRVGAVDDPPGKSGLAHFVEHVTFGGTQRFSRRAFGQEIESISRDNGALTTKAFTLYYETVLPVDLPRAMRVEAERMHNVVVSAKSLAAERKEVLEERRPGTGDEEAPLREAVEAALYDGTTLGISVLGRPSEFAAIGETDVTAFYRAMYVPSNAVVVIYGPVEAGDVRRLAEEHYGNLPTSAAPFRNVVSAVPPAERKQLVITDKRAREPLWLRQYVAPTSGPGSAPEVFAVHVLARLLGSVRLQDTLVKERALAKEVDVEYTLQHPSSSTLTLRVALEPGKDPNEVSRLVDLDLQSLVRDGPADDEFVRARSIAYVETSPFEHDIPIPPQVVGNALMLGWRLEDVQTWPKRLAVVTRQQVHEAARMLVASPRSVTGVRMPN